MIQAQTAAPRGYVIGATQGEHLVHFRDGGNVFINAGAATGSDSLALGTQQVPVDAGIPIHRHLRMDEAFYVLEGSGIFTLNVYDILSRRAERYSSPGMLGMGSPIPITNCSCSGSWRLQAWTSSTPPAIRPGSPQSS